MSALMYDGVRSKGSITTRCGAFFAASLHQFREGLKGASASLCASRNRARQARAAGSRDFAASL